MFGGIESFRSEAVFFWWAAYARLADSDPPRPPPLCSYVLNPFIVMSCVGRSSTTINNAAVILALYGAVRGMTSCSCAFSVSMRSVRTLRSGTAQANPRINSPYTHRPTHLSTMSNTLELFSNAAEGDCPSQTAHCLPTDRSQLLMLWRRELCDEHVWARAGDMSVHVLGAAAGPRRPAACQTLIPRQGLYHLSPFLSNRAHLLVHHCAPLPQASSVSPLSFPAVWRLWMKIATRTRIHFLARPLSARQGPSLPVPVNLTPRAGYIARQTCTFTLAFTYSRAHCLAFVRVHSEGNRRFH